MLTSLLVLLHFVPRFTHVQWQSVRKNRDVIWLAALVTGWTGVYCFNAMWSTDTTFTIHWSIAINVLSTSDSVSSFKNIQSCASVQCVGEVKTNNCLFLGCLFLSQLYLEPVFLKQHAKRNSVNERSGIVTTWWHFLEMLGVRLWVDSGETDTTDVVNNEYLLDMLSCK